MAGPVLVLVALRNLQLRTVATLLYSPELMGLASLAQDLQDGTVPAGASLSELVERYQYMSFAQGMLVVQVSTAAGAAVFGLGPPPPHAGETRALSRPRPTSQR